MRLLKKILDFLNPHERKRGLLLFGMIIMQALLDVLGVASIMPFMAVLANPDSVETNVALKNVYVAASYFGVSTRENFLFALGIFVFVLLIVSQAFKALTTYAQVRYVLMREYSIGKRLVEGYLHQPYSWFLNRHSADLGKAILSEVSAVITHGVMPVMSLIAQGAVTIALIVLLIVVNPELALIIGLTLTAAYGLIFKATSGFLASIGSQRVKANQDRFTAVSEAFGASKEVKVGGLENFYIERFAKPAQTYARHQATSQVIGQLPRFALEAIAFGGMLLVMLFLMSQRGNLVDALPIFALYAFAGYRLMPALQQVYVALTQLRFAAPAINALHEDLVSLQSTNLKTNNASPTSITLSQAISLKNITYYYPNAVTPALKNISLSIAAKSKVALVGTTGSGKTTLVDLILCLLEPQEGVLAIDGQPITGQYKRAWQNAIGYVPQQIYLIDDSITANIAFGIQADQIDEAAIKSAAKIANLHTFVTNELPQGYDTIIGERGIRLSGGQRQRIGIARALYHSPDVLIMDEATSALDNLTEQAVMEAVRNLERKITIILIAHRLSTVKECDQIFLLEKGQLKKKGKFEELKLTDEHFRAMATTN